MRRARMCAGRVTTRRAIRGLTLLEMIFAIVVLGVALTALLNTFASVSRSGSDPLIDRQLELLADELLTEIALKPIQTSANAAAVDPCDRSLFNDIDDYNGYHANSACLIDGTPIAELDGYSVDVAVQTAPFQGVPGARLITVTTAKAGRSITVKRWRTNYAD